MEYGKPTASSSSDLSDLQLSSGAIPQGIPSYWVQSLIYAPISVNVIWVAFASVFNFIVYGLDKELNIKLHVVISIAILCVFTIVASLNMIQRYDFFHSLILIWAFWGIHQEQASKSDIYEHDALIIGVTIILQVVLALTAIMAFSKYYFRGNPKSNEESLMQNIA